MTDEWFQDTGMLAAGSSCPIPECGALAVAYRPAIEYFLPDDLWEFTCPRCGLEFAALEEDLLFQSIREEWLRAGIHSA